MTEITIQADPRAIRLWLTQIINSEEMHEQDRWMAKQTLRLLNKLDTLDNISRIKSLYVYKEILGDSFGGVMYDVANRDKYDKEQVSYMLEVWNGTTPAGQESAGGIMKGVMSFLTEAA